MDFYRINTNDLEEEELNYALRIRGVPTDGPLESRRRTLRNLLRERQNEYNQQIADHLMATEYEVLPRQLHRIGLLLSSGLLAGCLSRLVHYHMRVRRYIPKDATQTENQKLLLDLISRMGKQYFDVNFEMVYGLTHEREILATEIVNHEENSVDNQPVLPPGGVVRREIQPTGTLSEPGRSTGTMGDRNVEMSSGVDPDLCEGAIGGEADPNVGQWDNRSTSLPLNLRHSVHDDTLFGSQIGVAAPPRRSQPPPGFASHSLRGAQHVDEVLRPEVLNPVSGFKTPPVNQTDPSVPQGFSSILRQHNFNFDNPQFQSSGCEPTQNQKIVPTVQGANNSAYGVTPRARPELRNLPAPAVSALNRNMNEYVHVSEVEQLVRRAVREALEQERQNQGTGECDLPRLSDHLTHVRLNDAGAERLLQGREASTSQRAFYEPAPPLQMNPQGLYSDVNSRNQARMPHEPVPPMPMMQPDRAAQGYTASRMFLGNEHQYPAPTGTPLDDARNYQMPRDYRASRNDFPVGDASFGYSGRRQPHQQCAIIEKWPKFSGDTNTVPVTDFLRQIDILCRSYAISKQDLRMHAHLLFKEGAYVWYTTYEEKFLSWEILETYLKMRYDNPNRDRLIREEMRNRRQRPNELFSAYLTDMEMLAQRMIRKMSEQEKFELVVENMKISYKRRLALEPIQSIEHLAQLCFKFDALESNLYHVSGPPKPVVNQLNLNELDSEDEPEVEDPALLYTLQSKKAWLSKKTGIKSKASNETKRDIQTSNLMCWNCQQEGHMWRDCDQRKKIFCHICGQAETTAFRCPNKHNLSSEEEKEKNE